MPPLPFYSGGQRLRPPGYVGLWRQKPKLDPSRFKIIRRGPAAGGLYFARPIGPPAPRRRPRTPAPGAPPAPTQLDPYAGYPDFARRRLAGMAREEQQAITTGTNVANWLAQALTPLADISRQAGTAFQAGMLAPNATVGLPPVASTTPGGQVADPNAYATQANAGALGTEAAGAQRGALTMGALDANAMNALSQGLISEAGQRVADIPALFAKNRDEYLSRVEEFMANQDFQERQFREQRRQWAIERTDAERQRRFDREIARATLGLETIKANQPGEEPWNSPNKLAADGYVGGWKVKPKKGGPFVQGTDGRWYKKPEGAGGGSGRQPGEYTRNELAKQGFKPLPKGAGPKWRQSAVRATDGSLWYKPPKEGSAGGSGGRTRSANTAIRFFDTWWAGETDQFGRVKTRGWRDIVKSGERSVQNAIDRFFRLVEPYGLSEEQDIAIAKRYFSDRDLREWLRRHGG